MNIQQAIIDQSPTTESDFICSECKNYKGGLVCTKNIFIATSMSNMKGCFGFEQETIESLKEKIKDLKKKVN